MRKLAFVCSILSFLYGAEVQADESLLVALTEIKQNYIEQTSTEDLAIIALKSLNKIDKKVQVANDGTRLTLYYDAKVYKNFNKPKYNQVAVWTSTVEKIVTSFSQISDKPWIDETIFDGFSLLGYRIMNSLRDTDTQLIIELE